MVLAELVVDNQRKWRIEETRTLDYTDQHEYDGTELVDEKELGNSLECNKAADDDAVGDEPFDYTEGLAENFYYYSLDWVDLDGQYSYYSSGS